MGFVDEVKFFVKAGDGGNGCVSFRREKFIPKGDQTGAMADEAAQSFLKLMPANIP